MENENQSRLFNNNSKIQEVNTFESVAEQTAYPVLKKMCLKNDYSLIYQYSVREGVPAFYDYRDWVYEKWGGELPSWIYHNENCDGCNICYSSGGYEFEKYRIDFVLNRMQRKIGIEIDGMEFHKDKLIDKMRDKKLRLLGFEMFHFQAKMVFSDKNRFEKKISVIL